MSKTAVAAALGAVSLAGFLLLGALRGAWTSVQGDEGTYLAMAASVVHDGDLRFDEADLARLEEKGPDAARSTLILQRTDAGVSYSKPVLLALLVAPFYRLFGDHGLVAFNLVVLALSLWPAAVYLRRLGPPDRAALTLVTFAGCSVLPAYVAWRMTDLFQVALTLAGLVLCLWHERRGDGGEAAAPGGRESKGGPPAADSPLPAGTAKAPPAAGVAADPVPAGRRVDSWGAPLAGGLLLGLAVSLRFPNLLVAAAPVAVLGLRRRRRAAVAALLGIAAAFLLTSGLGLALTGTANPYKAVRASFTPETGYPVGEAEAANREFTVNRKTQSMTWRPDWEPAVSAYAAFYFLLGRHTGLLVYFPAALVLLLCALRRLDRTAAVLLLAAAGIALFYLIWQPRNYFGGASFIGNRYFLSAYPLLLVALPALPRRRTLAWCWLLGLLVLASALLSVWRVRDFAPESQSHAYAGLFRLLPYESTAALIEGRRDRYWLDDFVRFVDPFARVGDDGFQLRTGRRPAEMLLASRRASGRLLFRVDSEADGLALEAGDWRGTRRLPLDTRAGGGTAVVEVDAAPAWRHHPFWWSPGESYHARALRLRLLGADGRSARARVRYAGDAAALEAMFVRHVLGARLPERATAGATDRLRLQLQNMSHIRWSREGPLPVLLGYRLLPESPASPPLAGARVRLPRDVPSGDPFTANLDVTWPETPGTYRLVVDLLVEGVGWFAGRVGEPVAQGPVVVEPRVEKPPAVP